MRAVEMRTHIGRRTLLAGMTALAVPSQRAEAQSSFTGRYFPIKEFLALPKTYASVTGGTLAIGFAPGKLTLPRDEIAGWIKTGAEEIAHYLGSFPGRGAAVLVVPAPGRGVQRGTAYPYDPGAIRIIIGENVTNSELRADWKLVHEFFHLSMPHVPNRLNWMHEGMATYVEPIARVKGGRHSTHDLWASFVRMMPQGLPARGDRGLDHTPTWGRIYWGGALFYLLADIEIRKRTSNKKGLADALAGIGAKGGVFGARWAPERIFDVADEAIGSQVFRDLHRIHGKAAVHVDLNALWASLGVVPVSRSKVRFDQNAPLADIRRAITAA